MDWGLFLCLSPIFILAGIGVFGILWEKYFNPYIANYRSFNGPNNHWRSSKAVVKLTYKQWCDFAAIKPEAFCVEDGYLYWYETWRYILQFSTKEIYGDGRIGGY